MALKITIELLQASDVSHVAELLRLQLLEHRMERPLQKLMKVLETVLDEPRYGFILVAKVDEHIVGFAFATFIMSAEREGLVAWLEEFYLAPSHRARGIGTQLLEAFITRCRERGVQAIDLEVDIDHEQVVSLYERFGFESLPRKRFFKALNE